jgi:hypothetical protein
VSKALAFKDMSPIATRLRKMPVELHEDEDSTFDNGKPTFSFMVSRNFFDHSYAMFVQH